MEWLEGQKEGNWSDKRVKWKGHERKIRKKRRRTEKELYGWAYSIYLDTSFCWVTVATLSTSLYIGMVQYSWHICTLSGSTLHRHCGYL